MIIKNSGLPGITLKAWLIFQWANLNIISQSGQFTSIVNVQLGIRNINFQAGTFSGTSYMPLYLQPADVDIITMVTKTGSGCQVLMKANGAYVDPGLGVLTGIYFYEL